MERADQVIEILFWIGIGIVFYTYLGYGIVLYLMVKIKELFVKPRLPRLPETLPEATLLIAAYNEEAIVASKMVNCRQLDYPADKLRLVWITDGSNDNTNERLKEYPEVTVLYQPRRQGKTAALNRALPSRQYPLRHLHRRQHDAEQGRHQGDHTPVQRPTGRLRGRRETGRDTSRARSHRRRRHILEIRVRPQATGLPPILRRPERQASSSPSVPPSSSRCPRIPCWTISSLSLRIAMRGYKIAYSKEAYALESAP